MRIRNTLTIFTAIPILFILLLINPLSFSHEDEMDIFGSAPKTDILSFTEAQNIVRRQYMEQLGREPDQDGLQYYTRMLIEEDKNEAWLAQVLSESEEGQRYRALHETAPGPSFDHDPLVVSIFLSILLALIISQVYKHTHTGMNYELSFMSTLVLLAPIVTLVMLFIRGDLVLSLGLIGSLSIIRFRTPIKDTRDMVFLFWTIAVGLGAGTYNWRVVIISNIIMVPLVFLLYFIRYGRSSHADFILICTGTGNYPIEHIQPMINENVKDAVIRSHETHEDSWETVYELRKGGSGASLLQNLVQKLKGIENVNKVSLLSPKLDLPV